MLVDSHSHLDAPDFDHDRAEVLARARAAGVTRQVVPAVNAAGWAPLQALCAAEPGLYPAWGLHPMFLADHRPEHLPALERMVADARPVAVGECGLDFFVPDLDVAEQQRIFEAQLAIARAAGLPVIVHARRAVDAVIQAIRRHPGLRGVIHSFPGSAEQARQLRDLGFLLGLGGPLTYPRAARLRALVASMPIEQLLLETDAPDQPNCGCQGQRNEPARLREVLAVVAALRGEDEAAVAAATSANAGRLFGLPAAGVA